jgi:hypothetical protein
MTNMTELGNSELQANRLHHDGFVFFDLPRELRDHIYSHLFDDDQECPPRYKINCLGFDLITVKPGKAKDGDLANHHPFIPNQWTWASKRVMKEAATQIARTRIFKIQAPLSPKCDTYHYRKSYLLNCIVVLVDVSRKIQTTRARSVYASFDTKIRLDTPSDVALKTFMAMRSPESRPLHLQMQWDFDLRAYNPGVVINFESAALPRMIGRFSRVDITVRLTDKWVTFPNFVERLWHGPARKHVYKQAALCAQRLIPSYAAVDMEYMCGKEWVSRYDTRERQFLKILTFERNDG